MAVVFIYATITKRNYNLTWKLWKGQAEKMRKLKSTLTNIFKKPLAVRSRWLNDGKLRNIVVRSTDILLAVIPVLALVALLALIYLYARPIPTADIKVPVATDQASYHPGEEISGIFFGEIFHEGEVRVLREVFCKDYKDIIAPPESARNGDFYDTQSIPRKIEGLTVNIGLLPQAIPVGANCVLQFTNIYNIQTPFGVRHVEYQYYTQNFSIVTKERRQQIECEAEGRKDCNFLNTTNEIPDDEPRAQESVDSAVDTRPPQNVYYDNRSTTDYNTAPDPATTQPPAPRFEERCTIDFIVKIGCRQEPVE